MMSIVAIILILVFVLLIISLFSRDKRGFDRKGIHRNGTKFDEFGYDIKEKDKERNKTKPTYQSMHSHV